MNLFDMARRDDKNIELVAGEIVSSPVQARLMHSNLVEKLLPNDRIVISKRQYNGELYRGFDMSARPSVHIKLTAPLLHYPFREHCEHTGWSVMALDSSSEGNSFELKLVDRRTGSTITHITTPLSRHMTPLNFPYEFSREIDPHSCDLFLSAKSETKGRLFLSIHKVLNRNEVLSACVGKGVELGPGLNPQVRPGKTVNVTYLEQSSPEDWDRLYNDTGTRPVDQSLWENYRIGEAKAIPFENHSLDFIFSSHVFEHLSNPLGYLEYWKSKLKAGGMVTGIVPDVAGCKDYVYSPCPMADFIDEYDDGDMEPKLHHYERWAKFRAPNGSPQEYFDKRRSIHVHFYTARNMSELLDFAVNNLGFKWFNIRHTPNHKDFYFIIYA